MVKEEILKRAAEAVLRHDEALAKEVAARALAEGLDPVEVITEGFCAGIAEVGELFGRGDVFLPDLMLSSQAMTSGIEILKAALPQGHEQKKGTVVIGTVEGDIHDVGKGIVVSLLRANGFEVYDLGRDVPTHVFIEKALEVNADIIGTSALLTTTMSAQKTLEEELSKMGLKGRFKTMVGGAPVTQRWADKIGADAYAENAIEAVEKASQLVSAREGRAAV
ncbi:MAG TPA: dimethylamine corrinoid protein 3 [Clostridia bacterium]|nr:dimethylamine corrinoid protein 3 [Clostridia bacterium]